jgi:PAS domain S-box-containing protein
MTIDEESPPRLRPGEAPEGAAEQVLAGGGEMGALMRSIDWARTPLGSVASWSPTLKMMASFLLANRFPLLLWWGPDYLQLYNDAYRPVLGTKHPRSMVQPSSKCFPEIWQVIGPLIDTPFLGGPSTWMEDIFLEVNRHGFVEETHFTIAYSPVPDPSAPRGIGGVLATVHEISEKVVSERRIVVLRDLGSRTLAEGQTAEAACAKAAEILSKHDKDLPFVLFYLIDPDGSHARLAGSTGVDLGQVISPQVISLNGETSESTWPLAKVVQTEAAEVVEELQSRFASVPPGPWSDPPHTAVVLPIPSNRPGKPAGLLIAGVSARLTLDEQYRGFLELLTAQVGTAIANARAYEEEKARAEALAELDRAKTRFFANVSHEFRTPLTLLLGPLEEALARGKAVPREVHLELDVAHRNALRLLKLVNTLLEFSRVEAGRAEAVYEPLDLGKYTAELVSSFKSAMDRAGIRMEVDTAGLDEPVYVDREMWEKIVLNLVSNAFKHTFEGKIAVSLRSDGTSAVLEVRDTGVGIPPHELPHIFERFHRVPNARSRTHEGTGIGLALIQELVRLHAGSVEASSKEGKGSVFTVRVPLGTAHLQQDRIGVRRLRVSTSTGAAPYVEEALRWLPSDGSDGDIDHVLNIGLPLSEVADVSSARMPARVLVADDNADMRDYVTRLLRAAGWTVDVVSDGQAALEAIRERLPDLVLSDVMMPGLDGLSLLRELRADPQTSTVPIILLSARAGQEARVEGADSGADDYLVKPYSAQELIARVGVQLRLAQMRRDSEVALRHRTAQFESLLSQAPLGVYLVDSDFRIRQVNSIALPLFAEISDLIGRDFGEVIHLLSPGEYADQVVRIFRRVLETGEPYASRESVGQRLDPGDTDVFEWQANRIALPDGTYGVVCYFRDISTHVQARKLLEVARQEAEEARHAAEMANRSKSEFLAAMSHELRTPLNAIAGYVQLLDMGIHGPVTNAQREALGRVRKSEEHLLTLINDVLNFAKLEAGRVEYDLEEVQLASVVSDIAVMIETQFAAKDLTYESRIADDVIAYVDREKLGQILLNLLSNAIKFTARGGRITIDSPARVPGSLELTDDAVYLRVADTGIGVPREKQESIFDPFVQVRRNFSGASDGTGLGLAISRDLAHGMGGDLRVRSVEGQGSSFTLAVRRTPVPRS